MLYLINNKYYILVQGYYKEVDVKIDGDNLDITPNGNEIEMTNVTDVKQIDTRNKNEIKNMLKPKKEEKRFDNYDFEEYRPRRTRNKRM